MYVHVRLLNGFNQQLWYKLPTALKGAQRIGSVVQVPLRNRILPAVVVDAQHARPHGAFDIKDVAKQEPFPDDAHYTPFIAALSQYHRIRPITFTRRLAHFLSAQATKTRSTEKERASTHPDPKPVQLTHEQKTVTDFLKPRIATPTYTPTVLHGVTGSGKTEVYKELIVHTLKQKKSVLFLLPEVTLALAFEQRLQREMGSAAPLYGFHSGTTPAEKRILWKKLLTHEPIIIIGVHLPVLLPIANLGLILVDEEHETGYQEKKHPKVNSKEAAILRAQMVGIPILLGSATPSIATLSNINTRGWHFFRLKKRFAGAFPHVKLALLSDKKERKNFWITPLLANAIKDRMSKHEQVIIFLNRRGFSFFVQCKTCIFIFSCGNCSVSLTLHGHNMLICHYCGYKQLLPPACTSCGKKELIKKGIGTQQVVSILETIFPQARIARADMDTTIKKKKWQETIDNFTAGNIDILVGTQTITKGYDFPNVTLVGILWADLNLNFPIYNAAETTLQQLIQVAGRAGRACKESLVIVQAMEEHDIFAHVNELDYLQRYAHEITSRRALGYPPHQRLAQLELKHTDEQTLEREAHELVVALQALSCSSSTLQILGPAQPPVHKVQKMFFRTVYIKAVNMQALHRLLDQVNFGTYTSRISFVPNPLG